MTKKQEYLRSYNKPIFVSMKSSSLFQILTCAFLLSSPLQAQLYSLHGNGVKKTERVIKKRIILNMSLFGTMSLIRTDGLIPPSRITNMALSEIRKLNGISRKMPIAKMAY